MSIASNITSAIAAIAAAINARTAVGASDYQIWLAQGNTGTLADYRASLVGADVDYAKQFTDGLAAAPVTSPIASETQAGLTQIATVAEALAGTSTAKAVSPAALAAIQGEYKVGSIADLWAMRTKPIGTLIVLTNFVTTNGKHDRSLWMVGEGTSGNWIWPVSPIWVDTRATLDDLTNLMIASTTTGFALSDYKTEGVVLNTNNYGNRFTWVAGKGWVALNPEPWIGTLSGTSVGAGFTYIPAVGPTGRSENNANGYVAPRDGYYLVNAGIRVGDNQYGWKNIGTHIAVDGNRIGIDSWIDLPAQGYSTNANRMNANLTALVQANAGQVISCQVYQDGSGTTSVSGLLGIFPVR